MGFSQVLELLDGVKLLLALVVQTPLQRSLMALSAETRSWLMLSCRFGVTSTASEENEDYIMGRRSGWRTVKRVCGLSERFCNGRENEIGATNLVRGE